MANHYNCDENLYWGEGRLSGWRRAVYNLLTRYQNHNRFFGHVEGILIIGAIFAASVLPIPSFAFKEINTRRPGLCFPIMTPPGRWCATGILQAKAPIKSVSAEETISEANQEPS